MPYLAARFTVIAPDLLGHGQSAKPRGDYSLGAYASGVRDLMITLGQESARSRSFPRRRRGDELAYQFPSGASGLYWSTAADWVGEVNLLLRRRPYRCPRSCFRCRLTSAARGWPRNRTRVGRVGLQGPAPHSEAARGHASLADPDARAAFVHTLRTIVEPGGQRVDASDRLYLAENIPFMLVPGDRIRSSRSSTASPRTTRAFERARSLQGGRSLPPSRPPATFSRRAARLHRHDRPCQHGRETWKDLLKTGRRE